MQKAKYRESTELLFRKEKYVIMIRDAPEDGWRLYNNQFSGRPFVFENYTKANDTAKRLHRIRFNAGNVKLVRAEDIGI